ncbi:MAG: DUF202 domain-containing protein [Aphanocapsa lilacina HA4352-LM1]|jgi:putative membrane protein|nr:DUF202 domain-containing protein [Aphanocapsa lilacina HA4352-LM1]
MDKSPTTPQPQNITNELAKERNRAAAERTVLAWIRTCLSMIGFGVGIDRIVNAIYTAVGGRLDPTGLSKLIGLAFVGLGTFAMVAAAVGHYRELRHLESKVYSYAPRASLGFAVAVSLSMIGVTAFCGILALAWLGK